jgi:WD40 repeat protein
MMSFEGEGFEFLSGRIDLYQEAIDIFTIALNENSGFLALGLSNNSVVLRFLDSFEEYFRDTGSHEFYVWSLIFSDNGNFLFSGDNRGYIIQWDVKNKQKIKKFRVHEYNVRHFRIYENTLISGSIDGSIVFTDLDTLEEKKRIKLSHTCKFLLEESKDELMIGNYNGSLELLNLKTNKSQIFISDNSPLWSLIYFQENNSYLLGTENGEIIEFKDGKFIKFVKIGYKRISEMIFYQRRLVVVSFDEHLRILNPFNLEVLFERKIEVCRFTWILNFKNQYFITCGVGNKEFHIWEIKNPLNVLNVLKRKKDLNVHFCFK